MGRTDDLNIQAEGVVPPVVERSRGEHGEPAPERDEGSHRPVKSPDLDCGFLLSAVLTESGRENQVRAGESRENRSKLNAQVRGSPESVPADRSVPGNIPIEPKGGGSDSNRGTPDIPRDRPHAGQDCALRGGCDGVRSSVCHGLTLEEPEVGAWILGCLAMNSQTTFQAT